MINFTDNDLALMKIQMYEPDKSIHFSWPEEKLKALLHRLECAEAVIAWSQPACFDLLEAWLKSKGEPK